MSFICDSCGNFTLPGVSMNHVIIQTRHRVYEKTVKDKNGFLRHFKSEGSEIVKEEKYCPRCYTLKTGNTPNVGRKRVDTGENRRTTTKNVRPGKHKWRRK